MQTKLIDGKQCQLRDVIYSDFGAVTETDKKIAEIKSQGQFKTEEGRRARLKDVEYSWDNNPYEYDSDLFVEDKNFSSGSDSLIGDTAYASTTGTEEAIDTEYAMGTLPRRLIFLKKPLYFQLKELYREHSRVMKSKGKKFTEVESDLMMNDFRFEILRIISAAKNEIVHKGGNMDTILKISSIKTQSKEVHKANRDLTILFKRIEKSYERFGFIPRNYQVKLSNNLDIFVNNLVMDVYGELLERRRTESVEEETKDK